MDINDLYLELGKCHAEMAQNNAQAIAQREAAEEEYNRLRIIQKETDEKRNKAQQKCVARSKELLETIRLVKEGMDPVLAKLTASANLEDQEDLQTSLTGDGAAFYAPYVPLTHTSSNNLIARIAAQSSISIKDGAGTVVPIGLPINKPY
jgi:hypothetical protein